MLAQHSKADRIEALQLMALLQFEHWGGAKNRPQSQLEAAHKAKPSKSTQQAEPRPASQGLQVGLLLADLFTTPGKQQEARSSTGSWPKNHPNTWNPALALASAQP